METKFQRLADAAMAACLGVMAVAVFINVAMRYGLGSGIAASEELSRLLFVWMVFLGATAAYPRGEHMAFTSLLVPLQHRPRAMAVMARVVHASVLLAAVLVAWGAWQQVVLGMDTRSPVVGYPASLVPLPAFLCCVAIGVMSLVNLLRGAPIRLGHDLDVE